MIEDYPGPSRGKWVNRRSADFQSFFLDDVLAIRNEFGKHDFLDHRLEKFAKAQEAIKDANLTGLAIAERPIPETVILPEDIMGIADALAELANSIPG